MHKSTQDTGERLHAFSRPCSETPLDTSEQLPPNTKQAFSPKTLEKRARAKFITNIVASPLSKLRSPLEKAYKLTERCSSQLTETPGKLTGLYCGCRWCLVCSRIRTARLITGYMPAIEAMPEKWFLTLSRPNVPAAQLDDEVQYYLSTARLIQRHLREKRKMEFSSLRKIECTYNAEADTYHPHFHFIFDNHEAAQAYLNQWLERNPTALLNKGNQLKKADNNSCMELFKYFTKVVSKTKTKTAAGQAQSDYSIHLAALDNMFVAMRAVRTFQPCGVIKAVSEEIEPEQALESGRAEVNFHKWMGSDWVNEATAQVLTGYIPAHGIQDIANHLVYPAGVAVEVLPELTPFYVHKATGEVVPNENAHLVRGLAEFVKVYPMPPAEKQKRSCSLVPTPECAIEAQPVVVAQPTTVPAPAQMVLFMVPLPTADEIGESALKQPPVRPITTKKAGRPVSVKVIQPNPSFEAFSTDSLNLFFP